MRYFLSLILLLATLLADTALAGPCLPANSPNAQTVTAIKVDGKQVKEASGIIMILPKSTKPETVTVAVGCAFPIGTVIELPQRTEIELTSPNKNRITLSLGSRLRIHNVGTKGEAYGLEKGKAFFSVKESLDFFNVDYRSFMALVRGTSYSVQVDPDKDISFSVEKGKLRVVRDEKIGITEDDKTATIKVSETLEHGGKAEATYRLNTDEYLSTFKSYNNAKEYYYQKLKEDKKIGDLDRLMCGLNNMGAILVKLSNSRDAIPYFEQGLKLATNKKDLIWEAYFLNNLGVAYWGLGGTVNLKQSVDYHEKSLAIKRHLFRSGVHMDIASSYNNLGIMYSFLGDLTKGIAFFEKALMVQRNLFPTGVHQDIAASCNNLGNAYYERGGTDNLKIAIKYQEEALKIRLELFPSGLHPDIATSYNNLGNAYHTLGGTGNLQRAIKYHEMALDMKLKLFPSGVHQVIAHSYINLGNVYLSLRGTKNLQRAIKYYEMALDILLQLFPSGVHPDIAISYNSLGNIYSELGGTDNLQRAIKYHEMALDILLQLFPSGVHQDIAKSYNELRVAYGKLGDHKRAAQEQQKGIAVTEQLIQRGYISMSRELPGMYGRLAWYELFNQRYDVALRAARHGLELAPEKTWIRTNEAHALLYLGRVKEAWAIYLAYRNVKLEEGKTFTQAVLDDFRQFREKGLGIPAMDCIEEELKRGN